MTSVEGRRPDGNDQAGTLPASNANSAPLPAGEPVRGRITIHRQRAANCLAKAERREALQT